MNASLTCRVYNQLHIHHTHGFFSLLFPLAENESMIFLDHLMAAITYQPFFPISEFAFA